MELITGLPGFEIAEQLYIGSRTLVYRGIRKPDRLPVVIKFLRNPYPSFNEIVQFRNQYTIAQNLNFPSIIKTLALEPYQNSHALVMEDFGGISLKEFLEQTGSLGQNIQTLIIFLSIALQITTALEGIHRQRIIHKDIKPANILIRPQTKQIKLIDFSISSLLPRETQEIQSVNTLEGTLSYISPEQTGRMNRGLDYRGDFYSFGVTLYELLTGQLPYASNDPMELVHSHIAKPIPLASSINPTIPATIAQIVAKLMAKNAEDRYQSALGLQHDLQLCLTQLQQTGEIAVFELGQRDVSDRFLIPEKLYGRQQEVKILLEAFERVSIGSSELMLVAGFSGIGKTVVVNEVHKPITRQNGYFIKGKFDQFNRNIPFSAFVQAFRGLMAQLLSESDANLQTWKTKLLEAVGENGQVIIEVVPELEKIIGVQPPAPELSGTAAQNRFNLLFQKFTQVFTTKENPLVIFLDDLQWADSASLNLIQLLVSSSEISGYLLLIGAYRDNEVFPVHPLMLMLDSVVKSGNLVNTITLQRLSQFSLNELVADTLNCDTNLAEPLTELLSQKTRRNPFFATQFLKALHQDELIHFDRKTGYWLCDLARVRDAALTDDVVEFMALQLQKLPIATQTILKLAACIGAQFDLQTLAIVSEQSETEVATSLWKALQEGLILPQSEIYKFYLEKTELDEAVSHELLNYKFLHDRVQQAAYSLIPQDEKQSTHHIIGKLLLANTPESELEAHIFAIASQLNAGTETLTKIDDISEFSPEFKHELAKLNLRAGRKAKAAIAYDAALKHYQIALRLITDDAWQTDYALALALHEGVTETAYLCGDFEQMQQWAKIAFDHVETVIDRLKVYETQIAAEIVQANPQKAIVLGLSILNELGIQLPTDPMPADIEQIQTEITPLLPAEGLPALVELPLMTDVNALAILRILSSLYSAAFVTNQALFALIVMTQVKQSLLQGNAPLSAYAYASYGCLLTNGFGQPELGYQATQVGLELSAHFGDRYIESMVLHVAVSFILHRKQSLQSCAPIRQRGILAAIESGNLEVLGWHYTNDAIDILLIIKSLAEAESKISAYADKLSQLGQTFQLTVVRTVQQTVLNLLVKANDPSQLIGQVFDEAAVLGNSQDTSLNPLTAGIYALKLLLGCIFATDPAQMRDYAATGRPLVALLHGSTTWCCFQFYDSLAQLAIYQSLSASEQTKALEQVAANQPILEGLANQAPMNYQARLNLVQAEHFRVLGQCYEAMEEYDRAIAGAKANEYIQEEALANELAAKFYLDWGKEKVAAGYMQSAYYCYAKWGAKAKTDDLESRYPELLKPILQQAAQPLGILESLSNFTATTYIINSTSYHSSSGTSMNQMLDFSTLLQISQAISRTIDLEELLQIMTHTILQNSGADHCALILPNETGEWFVRAIATPIKTELCAEPFDKNLHLPIKLIQYVKNIQERVMIDDLKTDLPVIEDYLIQQQPKSVLCLPILNQGHLIGILYLHNRFTSGVFTSDRLQVIEILMSQAAISLQNAQLYSQLEDYSCTLAQRVEERTQELQAKATELKATLQQLYATQSQLIQTEKMSSLGQLVAGIAHEINNPVNFIHGNLKHTHEYITSLSELIDLYQELSPQPQPKIQAKIAEINLEFILEDLPKTLSSMTTGTERIRQIVKSLRNFSRLDESELKPIDIHSGIESTLLILQHLLQGNEKHPEIQVIKDYGELPLIKCYASAINQVFMHILTNGIYALREAQDKGANLNKKSTLMLQTSVQDTDNVVIRIADNGIGIDPSVVNKIFEPFFTTKPVGKGTGLGLSASYSIIVDKHRGSIEVNSTLGEGTEFAIIFPMQ